MDQLERTFTTAKASPDKHLRDIAGMLKVSRDIIDRAYVAGWAKELDVLDIWQAILQRVGQS